MITAIDIQKRRQEVKDVDESFNIALKQIIFMKLLAENNEIKCSDHLKSLMSINRCLVKEPYNWCLHHKAQKLFEDICKKTFFWTKTFRRTHERKKC